MAPKWTGQRRRRRWDLFKLPSPSPHVLLEEEREREGCMTVDPFSKARKGEGGGRGGEASRAGGWSL